MAEKYSPFFCHHIGCAILESQCLVVPRADKKMLITINSVALVHYRNAVAILE
jgi:hypothetical protein